MTFTQRFFDGRVPAAGRREALDEEHLRTIDAQVDKVTAHLECFRFRAALAEVMALARASNVYLDRKQPWKQRKEDLAACGATLNVCIRSVRGLAVLMAPFLPFAAEKTARMLGLPDDGPLAWPSARQELPEGHPLGEPVMLFRKLEDAEIEAKE